MASLYTGSVPQDILRLSTFDIVVQSLTTFNGIYPVGNVAPSAVFAIGGAPAAGTTGNNTADTNGTVYVSELWLPVNKTLTGAGWLIGTTGGSDKAIVSLYSATGTLLANSTTSGVTVGTGNTFQSIAFTATYAAVMGKYFVGYCANGTTATFQTYSIAGSPFMAGSGTQTFGTPASITAPTTFTANQGPICFVY